MRNASHQQSHTIDCGWMELSNYTQLNMLLLNYTPNAICMHVDEAKCNQDTGQFKAGHTMLTAQSVSSSLSLPSLWPFDQKLVSAVVFFCISCCRFLTLLSTSNTYIYMCIQCALIWNERSCLRALAYRI